MVENACRALWIAQAHTVFMFTASYLDDRYLERENLISPRAEDRRRRRKIPRVVKWEDGENH